MTHKVRIPATIDKADLQILFQPQIDTLTGSIIGAEALVRWIDPIMGPTLLPAKSSHFVQEKHERQAVGEWLLRETCQQGKHWLDRGLLVFNLAVNICPHLLAQSNICKLIPQILAETQFPANALILEVSEIVLMDNPESRLAILNPLFKKGIRFAVGEFGAGYSSLNVLKQFPLEILKIDKELIHGIPDNEDDKDITANIVAMGHALNLKVFADGVESPEQMSFLRKIGCDGFQGILSSPPFSSMQFTEFVRDRYQR
jgi:EAL domain-containing protein (putative c-di-GMP-specific phosphodiesterase class I)